MNDLKQNKTKQKVNCTDCITQFFVVVNGVKNSSGWWFGFYHYFDRIEMSERRGRERESSFMKSLQILPIDFKMMNFKIYILYLNY